MSGYPFPIFIVFLPTFLKHTAIHKQFVRKTCRRHGVTACWTFDLSAPQGQCYPLGCLSSLRRANAYQGVEGGDFHVCHLVQGCKLQLLVSLFSRSKGLHVKKFSFHAQLIRYEKYVSFRSLKKTKPHPDWSSLGVYFIFSDSVVIHFY